MRPPTPTTALLRHVCARTHHARPSSTSSRAGLRSFPAWFVRGGTSNGLVIRAADLPPSPSSWSSVLAPAMGSPDAQHGRQLDGMGSGLSSTSKLVVLSSPPCTTTTTTTNTNTAHVAYTFVQVGIRDGAIDTAGNCGNMSSIVGPAAWDMGYVRDEDKPALVETAAADGTRWATLRLFNANTNKVIESTFRVDAENGRYHYCPEGDYVMDGVPGKQSCITMSFLDPAGAKTGRALPTGRPVDTLDVADGSAPVRASLVDVGNPGIFVTGRSLGYPSAASLSPAAIESDAALKTRLEALRRRGAELMGMDPDTESVPKIVLLFPPSDDGDDDEVDISCRAMSMGQAHKAVPLTLALCLGAAARMRGTLAWEMLREAGRAEDKPAVRIAHPSGLVDVGTTMVDGEVKAAKLLRTARVLMKGEVFY
ncbi:methylitaconate delta2-delta3-isomerase [Beauveria bassiana ARSEF 2860]|uniref:Methylitaconate delta2-delta3-isomerase n=1 Tax=Beauveria bassiana (strain ARSEF 2860) TaxID=655819 RepID=J5JXM8_BEAB2|nr:methylitaconate delta2-delta3-isomerase [Beauveria bassiana ARSEF 2860]EJP69243.1 methylitaconate delta2-delta3-isomerase [Beauveria bassiana ARSEF 2860]